MKKVMFVATVTGHIIAFHLPFLKLFKDKKWKTYVSSGDGRKIEKYCDEKLEISIARNPFKLCNLKAIKQLKEIINKEKFDIIHCHTPMGGVVARLAAKKARKKLGTRVIYTAHGFHFYKGAPLKNWLMFYPIEWYLAKYTDTLITINQEDYNLAKKKFSKRCKDIQYVPGVGIDENKFNFEMSEEEKSEYRKSLGLKDNDFAVIFPARLDKNKNQIFLINAMEQLVKEHNNIHLLLPGPDELNGYYQNISKEKGLENNIHFLGLRRDIPKLLKISNLAVSSSLREGLPVNVMEAFACNIPVVALKCRGMEDLIENGKNGYIVNNQKEFIDKVSCYSSTIEKIKYINVKKFGINNILNRITNIYFE